LPKIQIIQHCVLIQQEDSIRTTNLSLVVASAAATAVLGLATVEGLTSSGGDDLAVGFGRRCCAEATSVADAGKYGGRKQRCDAGELTKR
jgi:hypothetical protein